MFISALTLLIAAQAASAADDYPPCDQEKSDQGIQSAMNICAYNDYIEADSELNAAWDKAAAHAKNVDDDTSDEITMFADLLTSQRAWLAFRDAQCDAEANRFMGGSIMPLIRATCLTRMTQERTTTLNEYLEFPY